MGYLVFDQTAGNYVSTVDSAAISPTGDLDLRVFIAADDYTPTGDMVIAGKWGGAGQRSYTLLILAGGVMRFYWTEDGSSAKTSQSTAVTGVSDGTDKWLRVTLDVDNGAGGRDTKFYLSDNGTDWNKLGNTVTVGATTSIHDGTAPLRLGETQVGKPGYKGKAYRLQLLDSIDGAVAFDADFSTLSAAEVTAAEFTEDSPNAATVTIDGSDWTYVRPTCALSGTITTVAETQIQDGGKTIILTLTDDVWDSTVGADNAITTALIDGLTSDGSEANGWNAEVRANLTFAEVERTSDTVVTITLAAYENYRISADETITVTVPASALNVPGGGLTAAPTFTVVNGDPTTPRTTLAFALETAMGDGWQVYKSPPKVVAPPAIVIRPADPYQAPYHAGGVKGAAWAFDLDLIVRYNLTEEGLYDLEIARETVSGGLPEGWRWIEFGDIGEIEIAKKVYLKGTLGVAVAINEGIT